MRRPLPEHTAHAPPPSPRTPRMRYPPAATHWSPRYTYGCPLGSRRRRPALASLRMRRRHSDTRGSGAPPPVAQRGGRRAPGAEVESSSPAWASSEGSRSPPVVSRCAPPGTIGLGCRPPPCRVPRRGGANPSHPASGVATPPPTSFLPSFLPPSRCPRTWPGLGGPMGERVIGDPPPHPGEGPSEAGGEAEPRGRLRHRQPPASAGWKIREGL